MKAIEQFIIDGEEAWQNKDPYKHTFVSANMYWVVFLDANGTEYTVGLSNFLIDPKHWSVVAKVRDWPFHHVHFMHMLMSSLAMEGKTVEQALEDIANLKS